MLQHAMTAVSRGLYIFPVAAGDKIPHPAAGKWGETATNDPARVEYFWTHVDPQANIGIACKQSQLLVVDLDRAKEPGKLRGTEWEYMHGAYGEYVHGEDLWQEMCWKHAPDESGPVGATHSVRTGSGGLHLYYRWPAHWPRISQASPVKGIVDVRGNGGQWGGYVLSEGSRTASGEYVVEDPAPPAVPPAWICQLVAERPAQPKVHRPAGIRQPGAISWSGLVDKVRNAGEGNRNNALLWAARAMCSDQADLEEAKRVLGDAAADAGLPYFEIERTIESAYRIQRQKEGL